MLPASLPEPFLEIARGCLEPDPRRRWTVADVAARLAPVAAPPVEPPAAAAPAPVERRRYLVPAAVAVTLAAGLAGIALLNRGSHPLPEAAPSAPKGAAETQAPPAPPAPAPKQVVEAPKKPVRRSVAGKVETQVMPDVAAKARQTIEGTVRIRVGVRVDASGRVTEAKLESAKASPYFADLTLPAARKWRFVPPEVDGQNAASNWTLQFEFTRSGDRARATRGR